MVIGVVGAVSLGSNTMILGWMPGVSSLDSTYESPSMNSEVVYSRGSDTLLVVSVTYVSLLFRSYGVGVSEGSCGFGLVLSGGLSTDICGKGSESCDLDEHLGSVIINYNLFYQIINT